MGTLQGEFLKLGLITEKQIRQIQAQKKQQNKGELSKLKKSYKPENLEDCETIKEFKAKAREILLEDRSQISKIIQEAHRFQGKDGSKKLIWLLYQVRDGIKEDIPNREYEQLLNRAFRRAEPNPTILK